MNRVFLFSAFILIFLSSSSAQLREARWITASGNPDNPNTWLAFRKSFSVSEVPAKAPARIAVDSKYWMWINGKPVIFEGGLKRGPNPDDTYYDEVDIAPFLRKGVNILAIHVWYFGKDGFSHKSSGKAGLFFDCQTPGLMLISDKTWKCEILTAFRTAGSPLPNRRLSESNILFDARYDIGFWQGEGYDDSLMDYAVESGKEGSSPWNRLVLRPIPQWKDYGLKPFISQRTINAASADTIICDLPYNAQITPYLKVEAEEGRRIVICTDNYLFYNGGDDNLRAEYITRKGVQEYESPGWLNGHKVYYIIPKDVKVISLKFRETGYNTEFTGSFSSSDNFLNLLWQKACRTLYITMRDSYMDCPDRERAQWTGDAVNESGETFYALSPSSHALSRKWLHEIISWQRADGSLYAPVPSGNYKSELPGQVLATVGYYGLWNYYLHTGDKETLVDLYEPVKKYLSLWEEDGRGTMKFRKGEWTWGDWGTNKDMMLLYNLWYYLAVKGMQLTALELGRTDDALRFGSFMDKFKTSFNNQFWNGSAYRHPDYKDRTDDRVQALAVVAGIADREKYPALLKVFQTEEHASPYMEKYVFEAMFIMNHIDEALKRHKKRFANMVGYSGFTTLFEGWGIGKDGFGGGTVNHAWSGGALTILSQNLCGISPLKPAYQTIQILPRPGSVSEASATVTSVAGTVSSSFINRDGRFLLSIQTPVETIIGIPVNTYSKILLNGRTVWKKGRYRKNKPSLEYSEKDNDFIKFKVNSGTWKFESI
jgi:hypothetical protein